MADFIRKNIFKFPFDKQSLIIDYLDEVSPDSENKLDKLNLFSPRIAITISFLFGFLGFDRFYVHDYGQGIIKFFTLGALGFWTILDWFLIANRARNINYKKLTFVINITLHPHETIEKELIEKLPDV